MSTASNSNPPKCGGCKNSFVKSGVSCKNCPKIFHRSCAQKVKKCCDEELTAFFVKPNEEDP